MGKQATGRDSKIVLYDEDTFGEPPSSPDGIILPFVSTTLRAQQELNQSETIRGTRGEVEPQLGNKNPNGNIVTEIAPEGLGKMLKHLFGEVDSSGTNEHVFTASDEPREGLMVERDYGSAISGNGRVERFLGCRIGSAEIQVQNSGFPRITWQILGANATLQEELLDGDPTQLAWNAFTSIHAKLKKNDSKAADIREFNATLDNDADDDQYTVGGEGKRVDLPFGFFRASGRIVARFTSAEYIKIARDGDSFKLELDFQRGSGDGTAGNERLRIELPSVRLTPTSPEVNGPRGVQVNMDWMSYQEAGGELPKATLYNEVESV